MMKQGTLNTFPIPRLFKALVENNYSGQLHLQSGAEKRVIFFTNGEIKNAHSNAEHDRVYAILIRQKRIDSEQLGSLREVLKKSSGPKEMQLLVQKGFLKGNEVMGAIKSQVVQIVLRSYRWKEGQFKTVEQSGIAGKQKMILDISFEKIHWIGIRDYCPEDVIKELLPFEETVFLPVKNLTEKCSYLGMTSAEMQIINKFDGKNTLKTISDQVNLNPLQVKKLAYCLNSLNVIKIVDVVGSDSFSTSRETQGTSVETTTSTPVEPKGDSQVQEEITRLVRTLKDKNPYEILRVSKNASIEQIHVAYRKMAKEYHPDKFKSRVDRESWKTVQDIFLKISEAYQLLSDPIERRKVDSSLEDKQGSSLGTTGSGPRIQDSEKCYNDGMKFLEKGDYEQAITKLQTACYLSVKNDRYLAALAEAQSHDSRKLREAKNNIMKAIDMKPNEPEYHAIMGEIYLKGGLKIQAKQSFEKSLAFNPGNKRALKGLQTLGVKPSKDKKKSFLGKFLKS